jgi:hypothetical protein
MTNPDMLDLYNECLSIVEETTDDRTAERVLLIACRLLQMADEDFARHCAIVDRPAATPEPFGALPLSRHLREVRRPGPRRGQLRDPGRAVPT